MCTQVKKNTPQRMIFPHLNRCNQSLIRQPIEVLTKLLPFNDDDIQSGTDFFGAAATPDPNRDCAL